MRILHVFNYFLNRTEHWCLSLINQLEVEQTVYAKKIIDLGLEESTDYDLKEYKQADFFHFDKISKRSSFIKFSARMMHRYFNNYAKDIVKYIKTQPHDIIHIHFADIACETIERLKITSLPIVVSFYGWDYLKLPFTKPNYRRKYRQLFELADAIIVEGPHGKKLLIKKYSCPESKIHICPLGIEVKHNWEKRKKSPNGKFIQLASFREKKGILNTLKAFKKLLETKPDAQLSLVGDKADHAYVTTIMKYIQESGIEQNVSIDDFLDYADLHGRLKQYDAFVHPSITTENFDTEGGAPTILFDAMQAGLAIISSLHCDIPFLLNSKAQRVLLSEENDIAAITNAMEKVIEMPQDEFDQLSKSQYDDLLIRFDIQKNAQKFIALYQSLLRPKNISA